MIQKKELVSVLLRFVLPPGSRVNSLEHHTVWSCFVVDSPQQIYKYE